jgi:hypothetical protein
MESDLNKGSVCALYLEFEMILMAIFCLEIRGLRDETGTEDHTSIPQTR